MVGEAEANVLKPSLLTRTHPKIPEVVQYHITDEIHRRSFAIELEALIKSQCEADENTYQLWHS